MFGVRALDIRAGDVLVMKKEHPGCGSNKMRVLRAGADFKLTCSGCGRTFMIPRSKCEKKVVDILRDNDLNG